MKKVTNHTLSFNQPDFHREVFFKPSDLALPSVVWSPPKISTLPSWADAKRVSIDVETKDMDIKRLGPGVRRPGNRVVGISFAIEDGGDFYLPMSHDGGDNCPEGPEVVWNYIRDQLKDFKGHILGANLSYDADWIQNEANILRHKMMDIQVADPLINELHYSYSLETICERLGLPGKDETILKHAATAYKINPKSELWKLPARFVAQYAMVDARRPLQCMRRQESLIEEEGVDKIWQLEQRVTPVLVRMRRRGVRIDMDKVDIIERKCIEIEKESLERVFLATGIRVGLTDVWKSEVLAHALRAAGYKIPKTEAGRDSVDKNFLDKCGEVGEQIHRARDWNKLRTTFAKQIREHAIERNGEFRIHCTLNQMKTTDDEGGGKGVRYGRTSCSEPNLQQQPVRHDEFGELWRSIFVADVGARWASSDWSQQEPRIAVHYAELLGLKGAKDFADEYRANPRMDIHQKLADISEMARKIVKNYVNGSIYGMGDLKMCRHLGQSVERRIVRGEMREVPGPEGQAMIDKFKAFAPWISGLTREAAKAVRKNGGYVWTYLRRKCHFVKRGDNEWEAEHKAFNRVGQGSAADQAKATMVAADDEGIPMQLFIHDEFALSFTDIKVPKRLKELQLTTVTFNVPMLVDLEVGTDWGTLEKVKD